MLQKDRQLEIYKYLDELALNNRAAIKEWVLTRYDNHPKPFYTSVDIRNAGFKVAPVDTNLFPAGFNNLDEQGLSNAQKEASEYLKANFPHAKNILIIPENFTRNQNYFRNLIAIKNIITACGIEVGFGSPYIHEPQIFKSLEPITILPITREQNEIYTAPNRKPDLIVLNNDLTTGIPEILHNLNQPIIPHPKNGWYRRKKSKHFTSYNNIIAEFCLEFKLDPWLLSTYIAKHDEIDFRSKQGLEGLAITAQEILNKIKTKYEEYKINSTPYIYIKADKGTFGMGIMSVTGAEEIININKKKRHTMETIKEGVHSHEVLIQEGIPTIHNQDGSPLENVPYLINGKVIGFIHRSNPSRDHLSNLNSPNAIFTGSTKGYGIESLVAELAALASVFEE